MSDKLKLALEPIVEKIKCSKKYKQYLQIIGICVSFADMENKDGEQNNEVFEEIIQEINSKIDKYLEQDNKKLN